ncbi:GNAT family N-acetyltransferase [Longispora albida]|uniref:GNAT family N-acetyltransferase n=1 Tax=Longispora albida TaxID=203523 RepID=UPI0012FACBC5|nr:GNAT family N-acetyltransferase [Longispora albida]
MIVRLAGEADVPAVVGAYDWLFAPPGSKPDSWDETEAAARLRAVMAGEGRSTVFVAEDEGRVIGFCTVYLDIVSVRFGQRSWIEDLAVDPGARSKGTGTALMDAADAWARERGAEHIKLESGDARLRAHKFYEARGEVSTSRCFGWPL